MGRKRTKINLGASDLVEVRRRARAGEDARSRERLRFLLLAGDGEHTLEELAGLLGRSRATLQLWLEKFRAGGLPGLLERGTSPGVGSPINAQTVKAELTAGLAKGKWHTAAEVAAWLQTAHGIKRARKSVYYWLNRLPKRRRVSVKGTRGGG
jgi:transposase